MAKTGGYRSKLLEEVKSLSDDRVRAVADFAAYLREREEWEATLEVLSNDDLAREIAKSRKAWTGGKKREFVSLDELKARLDV